MALDQAALEAAMAQAVELAAATVTPNPTRGSGACSWPPTGP